MVLSLLLWTCKDDDPKLDLSQKISFLWDVNDNGHGFVKYYAVVSDTSGNILEWTEIEDNKLVELGYPPDPNLVTLTIIRTSSDHSSHPFTYVDIMSFTGGAGKQYNHTDPPYIAPDPADGYFKFSISNTQGFSWVYNYMGGDYTYENYEEKDDVYTWTYGLYDDKSANTLVLAKLPYPNDKEMRYKYIEDLQAGDSIGVSPEIAEDYEIMDMHVLDYPEHQNMGSTWASIYGIENASYGAQLDFSYFTNSQVPKLSYNEFPVLFDHYRTEVSSSNNEGSYYMRHWSPTPNVSFQTLNASIDKITEASTKRIAVSASGDGDVVMGDLGFGVTDQYSVSYYFYTPVGPKVRMTLPQFSQDLIQEIPLLEDIGERSFEHIYIDEYNMPYQDFFNARMTDNIFYYPIEMRSNGFSTGADNGRKTIDPLRIARVHSKEPIPNNDSR